MTGSGKRNRQKKQDAAKPETPEQIKRREMGERMRKSRKSKRRF